MEQLLTPPPGASEVTLSIDSRRFNRNLLIALAAIELLLVGLDAALRGKSQCPFEGVRHMANLAREGGLGTWFMTVQTLMAGAVLFLLFLLSRARNESRRVALSWLFLSLFFIFMAADDTSQIHERLGTALRTSIETGGGVPAYLLHHFPSFSWLLFLMPFYAAAGIFTTLFAWRRLKAGAGRIGLALGMCCFVAALALDFTEGLPPASSLNVVTRAATAFSLPVDSVSHSARVAEEFLEMLGMTLMLSTFFGHLSRSVQCIRIRFTPGA